MKTETAIAKRIGGRRVIGSGCIPSSKGDVSTDNFLTEVKKTSNKAYFLSTRLLTKITREARAVGKKPAFIVVFDHTPLGVSREWVIVPLGE